MFSKRLFHRKLFSHQVSTICSYPVSISASSQVHQNPFACLVCSLEKEKRSHWFNIRRLTNLTVMIPVMACSGYSDSTSAPVQARYEAGVDSSSEHITNLERCLRPFLFRKPVGTSNLSSEPPFRVIYTSSSNFTDSDVKRPRETEVGYTKSRLLNCETL